MLKQVFQQYNWKWTIKYMAKMKNKNYFKLHREMELCKTEIYKNLNYNKLLK